MTRTDAFKAIYVVRFACIVIAGAGALAAYQRGHSDLAAVLFGLFALQVLSGRVQAYFWSDLLAGLHYLNQRDFLRAKSRSEIFLGKVGQRPWLKHLIWLGSGSYSSDAEVMALNNLGAAEIELGDLDAARAHLTRGIGLDPRCPLLYRNMGVLTLKTGSTTDAVPWFEKAVALGLRGDWTDKRAAISQRRNAALSTTGNFNPGPSAAVPAVQPVTGRYLVQLANDPVTPFGVVVSGLEHVFGLTGAEAIGIARLADQSGLAVCAGFDGQDDAQEMADQLVTFARDKGFSLSCSVVPRVWS